MLLRFGVSNHLSIWNPQELSFTASSLRDRREGLIECAAAPNGSVVPAAVIYGANASGKTNLLDALATMRAMVLRSHAQGEPGGGVPRRSFALDGGGSRARSRFDVDFVVEGVRHHYGFEASDDAYEAEWLYAFPKSHRRTLFKREGEKYRLGRGLSGPNKTIAGLTRPNSLFVSAAAQNGHEHLSKVFAYFRSILAVRDIDVTVATAINRMTEEGPERRVIEFLQRVGTGVIGYRRKETEVTDKLTAFRRDLSTAIKRFVEVSPELESSLE